MAAIGMTAFLNFPFFLIASNFGAHMDAKRREGKQKDVVISD